MLDYEKVNILLNKKKFLDKQFKKNLEGDLENIRNISNLVQAIRWRCLEYLQDKYKNFKFASNNYRNGNLWLDVNTTEVEDAISKINIAKKDKEEYEKLYKGIRLFSERALLRQTSKYANESTNFIENESKYPNKSISLIKRVICELAEIEEYILSIKTEDEFKKKLSELSIGDKSTNIEELNNSDKTTLAQEIASILEKDINHKKTLTYIPSNIDLCIGREDELKNIEDKLKENKKLLLLNGTGGIGKTTLAIEYLNKYKNSYDHISFVEYNNDIKESFLSAFKYFYEELKGNSIDDRFNELLIELQNIKGKNLLLVDDIKTEENFNIIKDLSTNFDLLITSREKLEQINFLEIEHLHKDKAKELFIQHYQTDKNIDKLLKYLDYHTLFIKLTAQSLKNSNELTIEKLEKKFANGEFGKITNNLEKKTFNKYLNELFNIDTLTTSEILILKKLSLFPSIEIKYEQLKDFLSVDDINEFDIDLNSLANLGWLIKDNDSFKLHQVIRDFLLNNHHISYEESKNIIDTFIYKLDIEPLDNPIDKFELVPYSISIVDNINIKNREISILMSSISITYKNMGKFKKALEYEEKALKIGEDIYDDKHSNLATSYNNISMIYNDIGNLDKALKYQEKALKIREDIYDDKHPYLVQSYNNISLIYQGMDNLDKALKYQEKALKIREDIYGDKHPDLVQSYNNISLIYHGMGNLDKALKYQEKTLRIGENIYDDKHPYLAQTYNNISMVYNDMGNLDKALKYQNKALKIREDIYDDKHPDLAESYNNIFSIYLNMGDFEKAKIFIDKAVNILQYNFPNGHPYLDIALYGKSLIDIENIV